LEIATSNPINSNLDNFCKNCQALKELAQRYDNKICQLDRNFDFLFDDFGCLTIYVIQGVA
jgi:hypothetical protein